MISDEDDLIESNSSGSSPPRETEPPQSDNSNEEVVTFDKRFEKFIDANTSKSICKCFENMVSSLSIDAREVFENG